MRSAVLRCAALLPTATIGTLSFLFGAGALGAQEASLERAADAFARAWSDGAAGGLESMMGADGVTVELEGEAHGSLDAPRAVSALDRFLARHESRGAAVRRSSDVGGSPRRGFAEIRWEAVAAGTSELLTYTVFAGFMMYGDVWRVSEVRVLR